MASVLSSSKSAQAVVDKDAASPAGSTGVHTTHHGDWNHNSVDGLVVTIKSALIMLDRLGEKLEGEGLITE